MKKKPVIGIQMDSLRSEAEIDFIGTLQKVAKLGYKAVEFSGFYTTPAKLLRRVLDNCGLEGIAAKVPLNFDEEDKIVRDLEKQLDYLGEVGIKYIITPWAPMPKRPLKGDVEQLGDILLKCSEVVRKAGLLYGYHHHDSEFKLVEDKKFLELMLEHIPTEHMAVQFNLGWMHYAGVDTVEMLEKYVHRTPIVLFKDYKEGHIDTEIGEGVVGYGKLLKTIEDLGIGYIIVQQEQFSKPAWESMTNNLAFFQKAGYA